MKQACFAKPKGDLVTPETFIRKATPNYKSRNLFPYCPACDEIVHVYGVTNPHPDTVSRFDHQDQKVNADPLDDCVLARRSARLIGLEPSGWALAHARDVRLRFFETESIARAYTFCRDLCRAGNLPTSKFRSMIQRADRKNIWAYADITDWVIPYILLLLADFEARPKNSPAYKFHFVLSKPKSQAVNSLWESREPFAISKIFSESGHAVKTDDNPYPISQDAYLEKAGSFEWILEKGLVSNLKPHPRRQA